MRALWSLLLVSLGLVTGSFLATGWSGDLSRRAADVVDESPAGPAEKAPAPEPPVASAPASGEWSGLLERIDALVPGDPITARELVRQIARFLADNPNHIRAAFGLVSRFDNGGASLHASVLVSALGLLPSEEATEWLLAQLDVLETPAVRRAVIYSLGQNRHGLPISPGSWAISTSLVDVRTPIQESGVASALSAFARQCGQARDPVLRSLLSDVLQVLTFSQTDESVQQLIREFAKSDAPHMADARRMALHALGFAKDDESRRVLEQAVAHESSQATLRMTAAALARRGDSSGVSTIVERLQAPATSNQQAEALLQALASASYDDPATAATLERIAHSRLLDSDTSPAIKKAAASIAIRVAASSGSDLAFSVVLDTARDRTLAVSVRVHLIRSLFATTRHRARVRSALVDLVRADSDQSDVRIAALIRWARMSRESTRASDLDALRSLRDQLGNDNGLRDEWERVDAILRGKRLPVHR